MSPFLFISYTMTNGYRAFSARPHLFCLPLCKSSEFPLNYLLLLLPFPWLATSYIIHQSPFVFLTEDRNQKNEWDKKKLSYFLVLVNHHWSSFFLSLILTLSWGILSFSSFCLWSGTLFFPWTTSCLLHHWWHPFFKHLSSFAYPRHHCHSHSSTTHNPCHSLQLYLGISKEEEDGYMWISTSGQRTDKDWMRASRLSLLLCSTPYPQGNKNSSPGKESN